MEWKEHERIAYEEERARLKARRDDELSQERIASQRSLAFGRNTGWSGPSTGFRKDDRYVNEGIG